MQQDEIANNSCVPLPDSAFGIAFGWLPQMQAVRSAEQTSAENQSPEPMPFQSWLAGGGFAFEMAVKQPGPHQAAVQVSVGLASQRRVYETSRNVTK